MAINVSQAFHRTSANPVDESMALTKAQMLTVNDNLMPAYYFTICQDDGEIYLYDKTATPSSTTGKFTKFEGGGSGGGSTEGVVITKTLLASGWNSTTKQQTLTFNGYDADMGGVVGMPTNATSAQKEAYAEALIDVVSQSGNVFTFQCEEIPSVDLPVTLYAGGGGGGSADLPSGGTTGQALVKRSNADGDVEWGNVSVEVDNALSGTSENPVQNKVVKGALDNKFDVNDANVGTGLQDYDKVPYISNGNGKGMIFGAAIKASIKTYCERFFLSTLPKATASVLGGIKVGTGLSIDSDGVLSSSGGASIYANVFNKSDIYSTTEKVVGCWTDGRPIYQKSINTGQLPGSGNKTVAHGISNISKVINLFGSAFTTSGTAIGINMPRPSITTGTVEVTFQGDNLVIKVAQDMTGFADSYVTLQYTKTTDAANSFNYADENDYSTTEHIVGKWIDGKPVYQKVIDFGAGPNAAAKSVSHGVANMATVVKMHIIGVSGSGSSSSGNLVAFALDSTNLNSSAQKTFSFLQADKITIRSDIDQSGKTFKVILQYTKTTD